MQKNEFITKFLDKKKKKQGAIKKGYIFLCLVPKITITTKK